MGTLSDKDSGKIAPSPFFRCLSQFQHRSDAPSNSGPVANRRAAGVSPLFRSPRRLMPAASFCAACGWTFNLPQEVEDIIQPSLKRRPRFPGTVEGCILRRADECAQCATTAGPRSTVRPTGVLKKQKTYVPRSPQSLNGVEQSKKEWPTLREVGHHFLTSRVAKAVVGGSGSRNTPDRRRRRLMAASDARPSVGHDGPQTSSHVRESVENISISRKKLATSHATSSLHVPGWRRSKLQPFSTAHLS